MFCDAKYEIVYIILGLRRNIDWNTDQKSFFLCGKEEDKNDWKATLFKEPIAQNQNWDLIIKKHTLHALSEYHMNLSWAPYEI